MTYEAFDFRVIYSFLIPEAEPGVEKSMNHMAAGIGFEAND